MKIYFYIISIVFVFTACSGTKPIPLYETEGSSDAKTATLILPIELEVVFNNYLNFNLNPAYKPQVHYKIKAGKNRLGIRYKNIFYNDEGDHEVIKSKSVVLEFDAIHNQQYMVKFANPQNLEGAQKLEQNLSISLFNQNNLVTKSRSLPPFDSPSLFADPKFDKNTQMLFTENESASILFSDSLETPQDSHTIIQLKQWWKKASKEEKVQFYQWTKTTMLSE